MVSTISKFRHVALIGKYHAASMSMRETLLDLSQFLHRLGLDVSFDAETASNLGAKDLSGHALLVLSELASNAIWPWWWAATARC